MDNLNLISNFAEFKELKNIDKSTMIGVLEDVFRHALQKQYGTDENFDVIINADKVGLTGNKLETSKIHSYSGYPGGFKEMTYGEAMKRSSVRLLERIIKGMLPKHNHLNFGRKLKVYAGANHPHAAQKPVTITL